MFFSKLSGLLGKKDFSRSVIRFTAADRPNSQNAAEDSERRRSDFSSVAVEARQR